MRGLSESPFEDRVSFGELMQRLEYIVSEGRFPEDIVSAGRALWFHLKGLPKEEVPAEVTSKELRALAKKSGIKHVQVVDDLLDTIFTLVPREERARKISESVAESVASVAEVIAVDFRNRRREGQEQKT